MVLGSSPPVDGESTAMSNIIPPNPLSYKHVKSILNFLADSVEFICTRSFRVLVFIPFSLTYTFVKY